MVLLLEVFILVVENVFIGRFISIVVILMFFVGIIDERFLGFGSFL